MKKLLLLHGALGSRLQFDTFVQEAGRKGFEADAINFYGHGGTEVPAEGYRFEAFADDILRYADRNGIDKINMFGYSMGGYAALYFASRYPERAGRIATLNVKFNWDPAGTLRETALLDASKISEKVPAYADKLKKQHGEEGWKDVLRATAQMMEHLSGQPALTDEAIQSITTPVLLSVGDKDTTTSIEETLQVHRKLTGSQLWVLPATPHPFEKVNAMILAEQLAIFFG
jgi:pimeloyl-ACP methyl ester carboxylesterase